MENGEHYIESIGKLIKDTDDISFEIRRLKRENQNLTEKNDLKINELQKSLLTKEATLKDQLTKSNKEAIQVNCGWAHWRNMPDQLVLPPNALEQIREKYTENQSRYIKIAFSLKLSPIKKDIEDKVIELVGAKMVAQDKKFEYKYTGGNI